MPTAHKIQSVFRLRQDDTVNNVDHTVGCLDVNCKNFSGIDHDAFVTHLYSRFFAVHRLGGCQLHDITGQNFACNHVVRQDSHQLFLVLWK